MAEKLTPRMVAALRAMHEHSDPAPQPSEENGWMTPRRQAYAFHAADAIRRAGLYKRNPQASGTRPETGAANTLIALRRRGLVAGGFGMAFDSATWWITPEGARAVEELGA
jgi:hypothetical protein